MKAVLNDLHALERMIDSGMFETGKRRIGAEQEMFLVDHGMRAAPVAVEVLSSIDDERVTNELARFNIEANTAARMFGGDCLSQMESELAEVVEVVRRAAHLHNSDVLLAGILPTLRKTDLGLENMTPSPRYESLNAALTQQRGGDFHILIKGIDELQITHDNVMLESCNTSFQVHFQVEPAEFAKLYNVAQAVTAPVLAAAVNSPMFLGQRLWHETRVALFQLSVDERSTTHQSRGFPPRVSFGTGWVRESVLEIFREQIARFRILLAADLDEDSLKVLDHGGVPSLRALRIHNGTTYRWNRACYGIADGIAHLRIENRVLPAGPTVADEVANAAFYFGLMSAFLDSYDDISQVMRFDDARSNFFEAARHGLKSQFHWVSDKVYAAADLITAHLLPMARQGLHKANVDGADIDKYLGIVDERVRSGQTGSQWVLQSLSHLGESTTRDLRERTVTAAILDNQRGGRPVHEWTPCELREDDDWRRHGYRTVGQFMSTDLFTVHPEDLVDLAANVMDWEHIRHVPVEGEDGRLVGIITHRTLLRLMARGGVGPGGDAVAVRDIMKHAPTTVSPDTLTIDAIRLMRRQKIGCLPVVDGDKLVGIITESDLLDVSARLLEKYLSES
ncbi:glutamate-cysteine ligase family protein [Haliangium sp.]|uniref:glutamate-cysteine ligase family protein n=1 Tax=Haliangium sp. TaxID=2663208 RepID=UPI003D15206F